MTDGDVPEGCIETETLCDFLEGRADPEARERVHEHTSRCDACRTLLSSLVRGGTPPVAPRRADDSVTRGLAAGTVVGRYVIEHEIGSGGMGEVYAARDPALGRMVAVKVLRGDSHRDTEERIRREAQAMARLAHPNVVAVHDVGTFEQRIFVAMEYVVGSTLAHWNAASRSPREIIDACCDAGRGLAAAHAAGIVHRDFKPENVFVGQDGRVRVGDFGLARTTSAIGPGYAALPPSGAAALPIASDEPSKPPRLTAPGTLLGTPYYIAPELYDGADADARSDQFSFCVTLFTTLYGQRPFDGDTFASLATNVRAGRIRRPRASGVPRQIRAAIRRGLSADPAARFPSLRHLLVELQPRPRRRLGRAIAIAAGTAITAGLVLVAWRAGYFAASAAAPPCTGPSGLAAAWNAERRAAIEAAFTAHPAPYAATALRGVSDALDRYAVRLAHGDAAACRAAGAAGRAADAELAVRAWCLESRRQDAMALIDILAAADRQAIAHSIAAVAALRDPAACDDPAVVRQIAAPPSAVTRAQLVELTRRLSEARAQLATGSYARARQLARPAVSSAHAIGYRPLEAEAELLDGSISRALGDGDAERAIMNAIWSAEAGRDDALAARARTAVVAIVGIEKAEPGRALALVPLATAAIARLGDSPEIAADLETTRGAIALAQRDIDAAVGHLEQAVALAQRSSGDGLALAGALDKLGVAAVAQGHADRAVELEQRSLEMFERLVGVEHPAVATVLHDLGNAHVVLGDHAGGEARVRRAWRIREREIGPDDPSLARNLSDLARAVRRQGRTDEALELASRAVAIGERARGPAHPDLTEPLIELGITLGRLGRYTEADAQLRRAEANQTRGPGSDPVRAMLACVARGDVLLLQSRWREASALYERALPVLEAAQGTRDAQASSVVGLARVHVERDQPARAVRLLERLAGQLGELAPEIRIAVEFTLARALWSAGGDRVRARDLAARALAGIQALADARRADVAQIEQWLASHRT